MLNAQDLFDKIMWDGSPAEVVRHGITFDEVPSRVAGLWEELEDIVSELTFLEQEIEYQLGNLLEEERDEGTQDTEAQ